MKNIKQKINHLYEQMEKLRTETITAIKEFVRANGKTTQDGTVILKLDKNLGESLETVNIRIYDNHSDSEYYEPLGSLEVNKNDDLIVRSTEGGMVHQSNANLFDIVEIYECLLYIEEEKPEDIAIENGIIKSKN